MPYALFEDEAQLTRSFPTEQDVLAAAERAGLVEERPSQARVVLHPRRQRAVGVILRLVEHRRVGPDGVADDVGDHVCARQIAAFFKAHPAMH